VTALERIGGGPGAVWIAVAGDDARGKRKRGESVCGRPGGYGESCRDASAQSATVGPCVFGGF
jgi:hypothetical protein